MTDPKDLEQALPPLTLAWTDEALETLRKVPFSVRKSAARGIEAYAMTRGENEVTQAVINEAREARAKAQNEGAAGSSPHGGEHAPGQGGAFPNPERDKEESPRQFVTFSFYKVDRAWRRLPKEERDRHKAELAEVYKRWASGGKVICRSYSTVGIRADAELMLWRISYELDAIQDMTAEMLKTGLGAYLEATDNLLGMTKMSSYADKLNPDHEAARLRIVPGRAKYIFVYPFVKTREWYLLRPHARQGIMDEHIFVGTKYSRVKLNTTYSFGLDDQDFVVAFESNYP
ncbi:MAG: chlorite dismutase family protein, partial [Polyangiaceae bacterium]|nr:chlorite dismutase family protein [Polyangiaceae bacterium]